jgi:hypothetical protein
MEAIIVPNAASIEDLRAAYVKTAEQEAAARAEKQTKAIGDLAALMVACTDMNEIVIEGTTPSWNDGDECVHSQSVYLNGTDSYGDVPARSDREADYEAGPALGKERHREIAAIVDGMESVLNDGFGTNWSLKLWRDGESIRWERDDCDRGY